MKRSTQVSLVLLASFSAAATLSGCEEAPQKVDNGGTFTTMAECVAVYDQDTCNTAQTLANKEHLQNAPKYNSQAACAAEYGADMCRPASNYGGGGNVFMPMMMGYMLGSAMSTPAPLYYGNRRERDSYGRTHGGTAPIFTSGAGYARNAPIGAAPFSTTRSTGSTFKTTKGSLNSTTAMTPPGSARGGFGSTFKPTTSFKSTYVKSNPTSFGRSTISSGSSFSSARSYSSSSSVSSRGGFGGGGRSFGGGFGG